MIDSLPQLGAAIRLRRLAKRLTLDDLAHATGISKPYLSNIETARAPGPPSAAKLALLETALDFPAGTLAAAADWIRTPSSVRQLLAHKPRRSDGTINLDLLTSPLTPPPPPSSVLSPQSSSLRPLTSIPLINRVAAGNPTQFTDLDYPLGIADAYVPAPAADSPEAPQPSFALKVTGDSMEPLYHEGDLIIVAATDPQNGDDCLVRLDEAENFATTFKRIFFEDNGLLRLMPLNSRHPTRTLPAAQVTGIFPVLWKLTAVRRPEASK